MGLLKLANNVPGVDFLEYRDNLYWSKYKYRARITFEGIRYVYWAKNLDQWLARLRTNILRQRKNPSESEFDDILAKKEIIERFLNLRRDRKEKKHCSIRIESNIAAVFSNDLSFLHEIKQWHPDINVDFTQVCANQCTGIKYFSRQPKNKYRVYLRTKKVDITVNTDLGQMLKQYHTTLRPSPALRVWCCNESLRPWLKRYCSSAYFIDYDDERMLSYLALMHGDIIGKKFNLEKHVDMT